MPGATLGNMGMWPAREPHPGQQLGNSPALGGSLFAAKNGYKMESGHGWETFRGPVRLSLLAAKKKKTACDAYPDDVPQRKDGGHHALQLDARLRENRAV
jgi:hypothetical protein